MKVVCAPDSFKESLTAAQAAAAMAAGVRAAGRGYVAELCPVADGGEGTLDALIAAMGGAIEVANVTGPLGQQVRARFGVADGGRVGIVELAEASGLALVTRERRDPMRATTRGTGELMRLSMERGCGEIIICIGGSATVDGGTGIAQALGAKFMDANGREISEPMCGALLLRIARIEPPPRLPRIRVACDVTNPLCGERGAAAVYGPQKGATPYQVRELDDALAHLAHVVGRSGDFPGAGAAGGAGFGLVTLCSARLERGIALVLDAVGFEQRCRGAALVLTGEGRLDAQSLSGKACLGVARAAGVIGVPTIAIVGSKGPGWEACIGSREDGLLEDCRCLEEEFGRDRAMREAEALVHQVAKEVVDQLSRC